MTCPLCGGEGKRALTAGDRNRETTAERFSYERCLACGTVFMLEPPTDVARYYEGAYHGFGADGEPEWTTNPALREAEEFRVSTLLRHVDPGLLIDVGAGAGAFAGAAKQAGFEVTAIEMDPRCCEYMSERLRVNAICSDEPAAALRAQPQARVISLWHVLEHLSDPADMLATAAAKLEPGGVLALGVPNPGSLQFALLGGRWAHLDAPRHMRLPSQEAIVTVAARHGLRLVESFSDDPFGVNCSVHGWMCALRRRPARGRPSAVAIRTAQAITRAVAAIEHRGGRGAALTLLLCKERQPAGPGTTAFGAAVTAASAPRA